MAGESYSRAYGVCAWLLKKKSHEKY
jgi:hypothetical protein